MIYEAIATAATTEEATRKAREQLGAPETADVKFEVLSVPSKKFLGLFGGSDAKVRAYYELPDAPKPKAQKPAAPKTEKPKKAEKAEKAAPKAQAPKAEKAEKPHKQEPAKAPAQENIAEAEAEVTAVDVNASQSLKAAVDYLTAVVKGMGVSEISVAATKSSDGEVILELDCGEDYGVVIGRRGDTLDSIQYLTRLVANKTKLEGEYSRISVNVGNYREKRKNTLRELAKKNSEKVLKYGRNVSFEPMNPYERRIIHTAVQEIEGVTSHSVGSDASRRVVITLAEGVKPTNPGRGGYNNRGRGGRGGYNNRSRNGGGRYNNNAPKSDAPQRAPRTDAGAEKVSLYGKIN